MEATDPRELSKFIPPTMDLTFKKVFQTPNLLKSLIEAILNITIESIQITATTPIPESVKENIDKMVIFDAACKDKQGNCYEIEIQRAVQEETLKRVTFYGGRLYCSQLKRVESYKTLNKAIVIAILNFKQFTNDEDVLRCYKIRDELHNDQMKTLEWYFIELPKFQLVEPQADLASNQGTLNFWLDFLKNADKKTEIPPNVPNEVAQAYGMVERSSFTHEQQEDIRKRLGILNLFEKQEMELEELKGVKDENEIFKQLVQSLLSKRTAVEDLSEDEKQLVKLLKIEGLESNT